MWYIVCFIAGAMIGILFSGLCVASARDENKGAKKDAERKKQGTV